jgi:methane monooxygenase PmoA-like
MDKRNDRTLPLAAAALMAMLTCGSYPAVAQVDFKNVDGDHISVTINGEPFTNFYIGKAYPKPFLAPLRTANGLIVTRRFPQETVEGESRDHPHHRGLFIGYGDVNGVNFWENEPASKTSGDNPALKGLLTLKSLGELKPGKKSGTIQAVFEWAAPGQGALLEEDRTMTFYAGGDVRTFDMDLTFTAKAPLKFADTKEGFFAIRLADSMAGKNGGLMTNSEGAQTEKNVWGKKADWVDYDGTVDGQKVGIVIFNNPKNSLEPPRWHSRDYGLFAVNPFGLKEFDPKADGAGGRELKAGDTMRFRYRVIIHPGDYPKKKIEDLYKDYVKKVK